MAWKYYSEWPANELLKENFGPDTPHINEIVYNTSMVFVNGHFSLDGPRPLVPNMVEIGGIHVKSPKPIPKVNTYHSIKFLKWWQVHMELNYTNNF